MPSPRRSRKSRKSRKSPSRRSRTSRKSPRARRYGPRRKSRTSALTCKYRGKVDTKKQSHQAFEFFKARKRIDRSATSENGTKTVPVRSDLWRIVNPLLTHGLDFWDRDQPDIERIKKIIAEESIGTFQSFNGNDVTRPLDLAKLIGVIHGRVNDELNPSLDFVASFTEKTPMEGFLKTTVDDLYLYTKEWMMSTVELDKVHLMLLPFGVRSMVFLSRSEQQLIDAEATINSPPQEIEMHDRVFKVGDIYQKDSFQFSALQTELARKESYIYLQDLLTRLPSPYSPEWYDEAKKEIDKL